MMRTPDGHSKLELTKYYAPRRTAPNSSAWWHSTSILLLCYLRGPAGIIVALAEQIG